MTNPKTKQEADELFGSLLSSPRYPNEMTDEELDYMGEFYLPPSKRTITKGLGITPACGLWDENFEPLA